MGELDRVGAWDEDAVRVGVLDAVGICELLTVREGLPEEVSDIVRLWLKVDACESVELPDGLPICEAVAVKDADADCDPDMVRLCVDVCDSVLLGLGDMLVVALLEAVEESDGVDDRLGVPVAEAVGVCEHEIAAVAPAPQHAQGPEHALVDSPVVEPNVPAGHSVDVPTLARQNEPAGQMVGAEALAGQNEPAGHGVVADEASGQ